MKPDCTMKAYRANPTGPRAGFDSTGTLSLLRSRTMNCGNHPPAEYQVWINMRQRCANPKLRNYANYGGRGIRVDPRWNSFKTFLSDVGLRPGPEYSIERVDNDGPYSPENCKWATIYDQQRNKRNNRRIEWQGRTLFVNDWEAILIPVLGGKRTFLYNRIFRRNWPINRAFTEPVHLWRQAQRLDCQKCPKAGAIPLDNGSAIR